VISFFSNFESKKMIALGLVLAIFSAPTAWAMPSAEAAEPDIGLRTEESLEIAPDQFLASDASKYFQNGDFDKALVALTQLEKSFPKDELIQRYKAMTLDRLGKSAEAIEIFNQLLVLNPEHIPTRYFLGQAYARSGRYDDANREWKQVQKDGEGTPYAFWAQTALEQTTAPSAASSPSGKLQRWLIQARYGYEFDSNVILRPTDRSLSNVKDPNSGRHNGDLAIRYRVVSKKDTAIDLLYAVRQSLHDDHFNAFNYHSEEFGFNFRQRAKVGDQDVVFGLRYDYSLGFLAENLYSNRNRWNLSADTKFTEHTQTIFYNRVGITNYGPDGFSPAQTSRDGVDNDTGISQFFYSKDFQKYLFLRQEVNVTAARGTNFDSWGLTSRIGYHAPVPKIKRLSWDGSLGFEPHFYPGFTSTSSLDRSRRRDMQFDLYTSLTYEITKDFSARGFYRFVDGSNQNNLYDYTRQIGGIQFIYTLAA
jgi:tetratricopeptide (TPR) repeat protein